MPLRLALKDCSTASTERSRTYSTLTGVAVDEAGASAHLCGGGAAFADLRRQRVAVDLLRVLLRQHANQFASADGVPQHDAICAELLQPV